jgi:hypothetical protein
MWQASGTQMARQRWHDREWQRPDQGIMPLTWPFLGGDTGNRTPDLLLANSRLSRRLLSLNARSAHLVGLILGWCWGRCRTFLEYGPLLLQRSGRIERVAGAEPALSAWELLERMGMRFVPCEFRSHVRPGVSLGCLPQWHGAGM